MEKEFLRFLNREVNSVGAKVYIGREALDKGKEFITISSEDSDKLYSFWNKPTKKIKGADEKPKHTGGKSAYVKIYIEKIKNSNLDYVVAGACLRLLPYLEWGTQYLKIGKGKRKRFITHKDIADILKTGDSTATRLIKKMKAAKVVIHDENGYRLIGGYFVKGVVSSENKV